MHLRSVLEDTRLLFGLFKLFSIMLVLVGLGFVDILLTGVVSSYGFDLQETYMLRSVEGDGEMKDLAGTYTSNWSKPHCEL